MFQEVMQVAGHSSTGLWPTVVSSPMFAAPAAIVTRPSDVEAIVMYKAVPFCDVVIYPGTMVHIRKHID
jgi:hypothetical protein